MKNPLVQLILLIQVAVGGQPIEVPAPDGVTVKSADMVQVGDRHGPSVYVTLIDGRGRLYRYHYMTKEAGEDLGGGHLSLEKNGKLIIIPHGSENERRLVALLKHAAEASFGTAKPERLKLAAGKGGFNRMAMGKLLENFTKQAEPAPD